MNKGVETKDWAKNFVEFFYRGEKISLQISNLDDTKGCFFPVKMKDTQFTWEADTGGVKRPANTHFCSL